MRYEGEMTALPSTTRRLLAARLLTHAGDQAWDFAVPVTLALLFPEALDVVALYYLSIRALHVLLIGRVGAAMDRMARLAAIRAGIGAQTVGVVLQTGAIYVLAQAGAEPRAHDAAFLVLVAGGALASLGASLMDIVVVQDWIPRLVPEAQLARVNSLLKRLDLGSELLCPVLAGALIGGVSAPFVGLAVIAAWNGLSFVPEYGLLKGLVREGQDGPRAEGAGEAVAAAPEPGLVARLGAGFAVFRAQPSALAMLSYSLLWLSVLSPHGVLLTAWLTSPAGGAVSATAIGVFRALGAAVGIGATYVTPYLRRSRALVPTARQAVTFQAAMLALAAAAFAFGDAWGRNLFLGLVLASRLGLYGFTICMTEIRQTTVDPKVRGRVAGFADALNYLATLAIYGAGTLVHEASDFRYLVYGSTGAVVTAALVFMFWSLRSSRLRALCVKTPS